MKFNLSSISPNFFLNMSDFIPLITDEYKLTVFKVIERLPTDLQKIIWNKTLPPVCPPVLEKPVPSPRLARLMKGW